MGFLKSSIQQNKLRRGQGMANQKSLESRLKTARNKLNKIIKNLGRNDIDYTIQVSINSITPTKVNYCAQIESPANGLAPVTWVCESWDALEEQLDLAVEGLDKKAVEIAYYETEVKRAEEKKNFFEEKLKELKEKKDAD